MSISLLIFTVVVSAWVLLYCGTVVRWLWRQGNRRGAVGLAVLAAVSSVLGVVVRMMAVR